MSERDQGITKVKRGFVIIVPDAQSFEHPTVEIDRVQQNVASATGYSLRETKEILRLIGVERSHQVI